MRLLWEDRPMLVAFIVLALLLTARAYLEHTQRAER